MALTFYELLMDVGLGSSKKPTSQKRPPRPPPMPRADPRKEYGLRPIQQSIPMPPVKPPAPPPGPEPRHVPEDVDLGEMLKQAQDKFRTIGKHSTGRFDSGICRGAIQKALMPDIKENTMDLDATNLMQAVNDVIENQKTMDINMQNLYENFEALEKKVNCIETFLESGNENELPIDVDTTLPPMKRYKTVAELEGNLRSG